MLSEVEALARSLVLRPSITLGTGVGVCALLRSHVRAAAMLEDRILFIDGEAIVLDKPAGLPVDPPRRGGPSIASRLDELRCGFNARRR